MRRSLVIWAGVVLLSFVCASANAAITWDSPYQEFQYDIRENGGVFYYVSPYYFNELHQEVGRIDEQTGSYDDTLSKGFVEFSLQPGEMELKAIAKGPQGGVNPENGVLLQAGAEIIPSGMNANHGVIIDQLVDSFVSRRFRVNSSGLYGIKLNLAGVVNFHDFGSQSGYQATHSVAGNVEVVESLDDFVEDFRIIYSGAVSESGREFKGVVNLSTSARYEFKIGLTLTSHLVNWNYGPGVTGIIPVDDYKLGSVGSPLVLQGIVFDRVESLEEAIRILQILAQMTPPVGTTQDLNGDGNLGLEEVVHALQKAAGLRF
jgi:hypothetical protein